MNIPELENLTPEEREYVLSVLKDMDSGDDSSYSDLIYEDYEEIPVDLETFVSDDRYMGQAWKDAEGKSTLFPYWHNKLKELFPTNIDTSVNNFIASGARGLGKSEVCILIGQYLMYRLLCLKDPLAFYGMKNTEKFCFAFMNLTLKSVEEIGNDKFQKGIQQSPWFMSKGRMTTLNSKPYWVPPDPIEIILGSQSGHVIGRPIYYAFFDEVNFIKNQDEDKQRQIAKDMIDTAIGGMKTRFIRNGKNPTVLALASSKSSDKAFLEEHMKRKLESEKENVLVVEEAVWVVQPRDRFTKEEFKVAVGNRFLQSTVLKDDEDENYYILKGYKIINVPNTYKSNFLEDIDKALCDYAGIAASNLSKYISGAAVSECIVRDRLNPFISDVIEVGNGPDDKAQYYNFFDIDRIPEAWRSKPLYIHLDMSISGDKTGIAGVFALGKKPNQNSEDISKDMYFGLGFSVSVKPPKGRQVSFEKNRKFIYWLKDKGFNVKGVSTDSFQSYDLGQQLTSLGYNYKQISVDRVQEKICIPYQYLKSTLYEKRVDMYFSKKLIDELTDLERNMNTGKIDHSPNNSKDAADAFCGSLYFASLNAEQFAYDYGESYEVMETTNLYGSTLEQQREQITLDFENELKKISNFSYAKQQRDKNEQDFMYRDFGMGKSQKVTWNDFIIL